MITNNLCPGCDLPLDHCRCIQRGSDPRQQPAARALAHERAHWATATANAHVLAAMQELRQWLANQSVRHIEIAAGRLLIAIRECDKS
jgi:hypothetical protein